MFKSNQNKKTNMTYFFGGTAVGMTAGLLVGKLLSKVPAIISQDFQPITSINENVNKLSQDDNVYNPHFQKSVHSYHAHSKTASHYKNRSCTDESVSITPLKQLHSDFTDNINDLASRQKYNTNLKKISCEDKNQIYNISVEDNVECTSSNESVSDSYTEGKEYNNYHFSEFKHIKEKDYAVESVSSSLMNTEGNNFSKDINVENINNSHKPDTSKHIRIYKNIKFPEEFNNLPSHLYVNDSTVYNGLPDIHSSMINPNILQSYVVNASHMATCNSTLHLEDEGESKLWHLISMDEFNEIDLFSSTKQNNFDEDI